MDIQNQKDFWSGVMFAAFGLFFAGFGTRYTFGSAARMGPGYFPTVLGVTLVVMGALAAAALVVIVALPSIKSKREEAFQEEVA